MAFSMEDLTTDSTSLKCCKHEFEGKVSPPNRDSEIFSALKLQKILLLSKSPLLSTNCSLHISQAQDLARVPEVKPS